MVSDLRARAWEAAAAVPDPELPVLTIAELGVLRDVRVEGAGVEVLITPTYSGCPAMAMIALDVQAALDRAGIVPARVRMVLSPAWTSDWLGAEAREKLAAAGIAPPGGAVACPRCGSGETELLSAFGSTACKAIRRCRACREPFDAFKCH